MSSLQSRSSVRPYVPRRILAPLGPPLLAAVLGGRTNSAGQAPRAVAGIRAASGDSNEVAKLSKAARYLKLRIRLMFSAGNGEHSARAAPRNHHLSDQAPFGERDELTAGDDEVVERADVDGCQRLLERLGQTIACRPPTSHRRPRIATNEAGSRAPVLPMPIGIQLDAAQGRSPAAPSRGPS